MPFGPSPRLSFTLFACALLLSGCDRSPSDASQGEERLAGGKESLADAEAVTGTIDRSRAGEPVPAIRLEDTQGRTLALGETAGHPMLVNLWATWCVPCVREMPLLNDLAQDMEGTLRVVTISQDLQGAAPVDAFFDRRELDRLPRWLDPQNRVADAIGSTGLPVTVLYDAQGREVWRVAGDYDWAGAQARGAIDEAM